MRFFFSYFLINLIENHRFIWSNSCCRHYGNFSASLQILVICSRISVMLGSYLNWMHIFYFKKLFSFETSVLEVCIIFDIEITVWSETNFHNIVGIHSSRFLSLDPHPFVPFILFTQYSNFICFPPTWNMTMKMLRFVDIFQTFKFAFKYVRNWMYRYWYCQGGIVNGNVNG